MTASFIPIRACAKSQACRRWKSPATRPLLDWKKRARDNTERLSVGGLIGLAEVVKGLQVLSELRPLPPKEREQYNDARHLFVTELAAAMTCSEADAEDALDVILFPPGKERPKRSIEEFQGLVGDDELGLGDDLLGIDGDAASDEEPEEKEKGEEGEGEEAAEGDEGRGAQEEAGQACRRRCEGRSEEEARHRRRGHDGAGRRARSARSEEAWPPAEAEAARARDSRAAEEAWPPAEAQAARARRAGAAQEARPPAEAEVID